MLADISSGFYQYIRGAILILCVYNFLIYSQNRNKQFLYYSLYFLCISIFFIGQEFSGHKKVEPFHIITPSIHCGIFIFYLSFAREVLKTRVYIPKWDVFMLYARTITITMAAAFLVIYLFFGWDVQTYFFMILGFLTFIFTLFSYYHFYKIKNNVSRLFLIGSLVYSLMAILSFFAGFAFGGYQGFIEKFNAHPTIFMYSGSLLEAIIFSVLIGTKISILEKEKTETLKKMDELQRIVTKDYIILKDKTKVYISNLRYIKSEDHYLNLFLSDGKNHFVRGKLKNIKNELPPNFIQCHRSYLVNTNYIKQIGQDFLTLVNQEMIPVSRTYKSVFKEKQPIR